MRGSKLCVMHGYNVVNQVMLIYALYFSALTNTIVTVVLVDLLGIDKLAKSMALFSLIAAIGSMLASPISGW